MAYSTTSTTSPRAATKATSIWHYARNGTSELDFLDHPFESTSSAAILSLVTIMLLAAIVFLGKEYYLIMRPHKCAICDRIRDNTPVYRIELQSSGSSGIIMRGGVEDVYSDPRGTPSSLSSSSNVPPSYQDAVRSNRPVPAERAIGSVDSFRSTMGYLPSPFPTPLVGSIGQSGMVQRRRAASRQSDRAP